MNSYTFSATGHQNIKATHKTTLEFTKDNHVTKSGDCVLGINANFKLEELKQFLNKKQIKITIIIEIENPKETITETIKAVPNPNFSDEKELVIRTTDFKSPRTFATHADKASKDISRKIAERAKNNQRPIRITIQ